MESLGLRARLYVFGVLLGFAVGFNLWADSEKETTKKLFHPNGKIAVVAHYDSSGRLTGSYVSYFENGKVSEELTYEKGKKHGLSRTYFVNDKLEEESHFVNDKKEGIAKFYDDSGRLTCVGTYKDDRKHGLFRYFGSDGGLVGEDFFEMGVRTKANIYDGEGRFIRKEEYSDDGSVIRSDPRKRKI